MSLLNVRMWRCENVEMEVQISKRIINDLIKDNYEKGYGYEEIIK